MAAEWEHNMMWLCGPEQKKRGGVSEEMPHDDGITLRANLHIQNVCNQVSEMEYSWS